MHDISIHAPHTGRDARHGLTAEITITFQSTRPIRGATPAAHASATNRADFNPRAPYGARRLHPCIGAGDGNYFNPRAPYGARHVALYCIRYSYEISIHAPHTGRDAPLWPHMVTRWKFQSTRPIRGATSLPSGRKLYYVISIHAPHTGRDCGARQRGSLRGHFNPRAPYGARRPSRCRCLHRGYFNPRAPYGARHTKNVLSLYSSSISIHAPHTGRDGAKHNYYICSNKFQSTRPIRGATWPTRPYAPHSTAFQSTRPIRGATGAETLQDYLHLFQSTRPIRGATGMDNSGKTTLVFQSTRPIRGATPECLS